MLRAKKLRIAPTARDRQREKTRKRLLDAARKLFAEHGVDAVSVTDIAKEAGVSHGMIYANFGDKAGLLYEIVSENNAPQMPAARKAAASSGAAVDRIRKVLDVWAKYDLADPALLAVMQAYSWTWPVEMENANKAERGDHLAIVQGLVVEAIGAGSVPAHVDAEVAAEAIFAIYTWGMRRGVFEGFTPRESVDHIWPQVQEVLGMGAKLNSPAF
jgi:AcrR family transcriptional regulator